MGRSCVDARKALVSLIVWAVGGLTADAGDRLPALPLAARLVRLMEAVEATGLCAAGFFAEVLFSAWGFGLAADVTSAASSEEVGHSRAKTTALLRMVLLVDIRFLILAQRLDAQTAYSSL